MKSIFQGGFTLIELLVVIAIIGILAAIVLVSLVTARQKGADAGIQSNFHSLAVQAELLVNNNAGNYTNVCTDPTVTRALAAARTAAGVTNAVALNAVGASGQITCNSTTSGWGAESPLKTNSNFFWCIDSTGRAATSSTSGFTSTSDVACN